MAILTFLQGVMNWFIPAHLSGDLHTRKRVQMFIVSHIFGPIIATPIPVFLWFADPQPLWHVPILAASIYGFWPFLALVKLFPRAYTPLAMASTSMAISPPIFRWRTWWWPGCCRRWARTSTCS